MSFFRMGLFGAATLSLLSFVLAPGNAQATTITFDDLPTSDYGPVPNGYAGLNWANWRTLTPGTYPNNPSGYPNGLVSPPNVVWQAADINGTPASGIFSSLPFTLNSMDLTAAWRDNLSVTVDGYLAGNLLHTSTFTVSTNGPTLETFDWAGIDQVVLSTSGGTPHAGFAFSDYEVALDNLTINNPVNAPAATPLPAALPLFASGLGAMGFLGWRRKRKAIAA